MHQDYWPDLDGDELEPSDFDLFHNELHGYSPFPWQSRLASALCSAGQWPEMLDLPTGSGKTTALEIALFALAFEASRASSPGDVSVPRRIFLVVDRRVVVDQAGDRARKIASHLYEAKERTAENHPVSARVAASLCRISGSNTPVVHAVLRGGVRRDEVWAKRPSQVVIGASTVDQVRSRLLFRGYGISPRTRSIHAGLLSHDTLYLLDEVHISRPFEETLHASTQRYMNWASDPLVSRGARSVSLSATASGSTEEPFKLDAADREHPVLAQRLAARKSVRLEKSRGGGDSAFVKLCAKEAMSISETAARVGVIVNRVHIARAVHRELRKHDASALLITGRMRPFDRSDQAEGNQKYLQTGRARGVDGGPRFVVATQTIEVGADLDFDGMISECASWDALVQRAGRLDRIGEYTSEGGEATLVVVARETDVKKGADPDPIYGTALANTWRWMNSQKELILSPDRESRPEPPVDDATTPGQVFRAPSLDAPLLLPAHLDLLSQTEPAPMHDPDVQSLLHGQRDLRAEVRVLWREDLSRALLDSAIKGQEEVLDSIRERLALRPPGSAEAISLPLGAVRQWLKNQEEPGFGDVEAVGPTISSSSVTGPVKNSRNCVRWRGDESEVVSPQELRPDDVLVVPAEYGGIHPDSLNWDPESKALVADLGNRCQWELRQRATVLLALSESARKAFDELGVTDAIESELKRVNESETSDSLTAASHILSEFESGSKPIIRFFSRYQTEKEKAAESGKASADAGSRVWCVLVGREQPAEDEQTIQLEAANLDEHTSFVGERITLSGHHDRVANRASEFAFLCGLDERFINTLEFAGQYHDIGKLDRRFQCWLFGGDEITMLASDSGPLAKSSIAENDRQMRARSRERAGYPAGTRHEGLSLALLSAVGPGGFETVEYDTLLHLVASHHGYARPFLPHVDDPDPVTIEEEIEGQTVRVESDHGLSRLDSGVSARFWKLNRELGWYRLAWLEAIFRLADWDVSNQEALSEEHS